MRSWSLWAIEAVLFVVLILFLPAHRRGRDFQAGWGGSLAFGILFLMGLIALIFGVR